MIQPSRLAVLAVANSCFVLAAGHLFGDDLRLSVIEVRGEFAKLAPDAEDRIDVGRRGRYRPSEDAAGGPTSDRSSSGDAVVVAKTPEYVAVRVDGVLPVVGGAVAFSVPGMTRAAKAADRPDEPAMASPDEAEPGEEATPPRQDGKPTGPVRKSRASLLKEKQAAAAAKRQQWWEELLRSTGQKEWPTATEEEQTAHVDRLREKAKGWQAKYPTLLPYETENFFVLSNIPPAQVYPFVAQLDSMCDMLRTMYMLPPDEPVFQGKAIIVACLNEAEFRTFESEELENNDAKGAYGICHGYGGGDVVVCCFRGDRPESFAHMLVHETSHGFLHRYRTPVDPPSWLNEGLAEHVADMVVPGTGLTERKWRESEAMVRRTGNLGSLLTRGSNIDGWQYGAARRLVGVLIAQNQQAFVDFLDMIKAGVAYPEALNRTYGVTPEQLVAVFGQSQGLPGVRP